MVIVGHQTGQDGKHSQPEQWLADEADSSNNCGRGEGGENRPDKFVKASIPVASIVIVVCHIGLVALGSMLVSWAGQLAADPGSRRVIGHWRKVVAALALTCSR